MITIFVKCTKLGSYKYLAETIDSINFGAFGWCDDDALYRLWRKIFLFFALMRINVEFEFERRFYE